MIDSKTICLGVVMVVLSPISIVSATTTHTAFKKVLQNRYDESKIACATCHVEGESRQQRNELGQLFFERLEHQQLSQRYADARRQGTKARREFDKILAEEFMSALRSLEKARDRNGESYRSRFLRGNFDGL